MRDEYSILNNVDIDFSEYEIEDVSEFEKKKMMKNFIKSKNKKVLLNKRKVLIAVIALLFTINLGINEEKVLAVVKNFTYNINAWLYFNNDGEKYSAEIGKTLEGNNVTLTLNEFFTNNSRIIINLNINKEQNELLDNKDKLIPDIYIDGKKIERSSDYFGFRISGNNNLEEYNNEEYNNLGNNEIDTDSNIIFEIEMNELPLNDKEDVTLVFSSLAQLYDEDKSDFTYNFVYDSTSYNNNIKEINVNKNITIGDNELSVDNIIIKPDIVLISGSSKGFTAWHENKDANYYYEIVDDHGNIIPLKEEIGKGAYFYRNYTTEVPEDHFNINTLKIIPYTFEKINTNSTSVLYDGRTIYFLEDKTITINLK